MEYESDTNKSFKIDIAGYLILKYNSNRTKKELEEMDKLLLKILPKLTIRQLNDKWDDQDNLVMKYIKGSGSSKSNSSSGVIDNDNINYEIIQSFLCNGLELSYKNLNGQTLLNIAMKSNNIRIFQMIFEEAGKRKLKMSDLI
jgi:ankyrin repeat protein